LSTERRYLLIFFLFMAAWTAVCPLSARADADIPPQEDEAYINLTPHTAVRYDFQDQLTAEDAAAPEFSGAFTPVNTRSLNFGLTRTPVWVRLHLENREDTPVVRVIELHNPRIASARLYAAGPDGATLIGEQGTDYPLANRDYIYASPAFRIALPPHSQNTFYIRVGYHGALRFQVRLWSEPGFQKWVRYWTVEAFVLSGAVAALALYALFVFIGIRERSHLYLFMLLLFVNLFGLSASGTGALYLWPDMPWWSDVSASFLGAIAFFWGAMFANSFLDYRRHAPLTGRLIYLGGAALLIGAFIGLTPTLFKYYYNHALALLLPVLILVLGIKALQKGYKPARIFLFAWGFVLAGIIIQALVNTNLSPINHMPDAFLPVIFFLACMLWTFSLTTRIRIREKAAREELEAEVSRRTAELREALARVRTLQQLLPICSHCKKIRDDQGYWSDVEKYIKKHTGVDFSHGLCPDCMKALYPVLYERIQAEQGGSGKPPAIIRSTETRGTEHET
jgi:hypothetical protein